MPPILALLGRPNVGKSTLFNRLTESHDAIVDDTPGVTRDRLYAPARAAGKNFIAVDTGGIEIGGGDSDGGALSEMIRAQAEAALDESDAAIFLVDARAGLVAQDREIAELLRRRGGAVLLAVNKTEGVAADSAAAEFQELGMGAPFAISAKRGDGIPALLEAALADFPAESHAADARAETPVIALAGRPNAGKSTLANRLIGESRLLVGEAPGTTRDSVRVPLDVQGARVELIDTAGMRRKARIHGALEKFSVAKTLRAIGDAHVALLLLDASAEIGTQDAAIAGMICDLGRSLVLVVNKWERMRAPQREQIRGEIARKLPFLPNPERVYISALRGRGVGAVLPAALRAHRCATATLPTSALNRALESAVTRTPPPQHRHRPVRLKFAHQAGVCPPRVIVHGSRAETLPPHYRRYLANYFARVFKLRGTPVRISARSGENPYAKKGR